MVVFGPLLFDVGAYLASGLGCTGGVDMLGWSFVLNGQGLGLASGALG